MLQLILALPLLLLLIACTKKSEHVGGQGKKMLRENNKDTPSKEPMSQKASQENGSDSKPGRSQRASSEVETGLTDPDHPEDVITKKKDKRRLKSDEDNRAAWCRYALERPCRRLAKQYKLKLKRFVATGKDGRPMATSVSDANQIKNRYSDVVCLDSTRVVLKGQPPDNDYIHASWFSVPDNSVKYICAQGPLKETIDDFWAMVYQEKVKMVIMLCQLVEGNSEKCCLYWPMRKGDQEKYGDYAVTQVEQCPEPVEGVALTHFDVQYNKTKDEPPLRVWHVLVTWWPDQLAPSDANPMLAIHKWVKENNNGKPIVVHCSAGVGRTATFVGLDYATQRISEDYTVEMAEIVKEMRAMRPQAIQSHVQYIFLHLLVFEYFCEEGALQRDEGRLAKFIEDYTRNANKRLKKRQEDNDKCLKESKEPVRRPTRDEIEE